MFHICFRRPFTTNWKNFKCFAWVIRFGFWIFLTKLENVSRTWLILEYDGKSLFLLSAKCVKCHAQSFEWFSWIQIRIQLKLLTELHPLPRKYFFVFFSTEEKNSFRQFCIQMIIVYFMFCYSRNSKETKLSAKMFVKNHLIWIFVLFFISEFVFGVKFHSNADVLVLNFWTFEHISNNLQFWNCPFWPLLIERIEVFCALCQIFKFCKIGINF